MTCFAPHGETIYACRVQSVDSFLQDYDLISPPNPSAVPMRTICLSSHISRFPSKNDTASHYHPQKVGHFAKNRAR